MISNKEIANLFNQLAAYMELYGENKFKIRSYSNAYTILRKYDTPVASLEMSDLEKIDGIGKAISQKIKDISESGLLSQLEAYKEKTPDGIGQMLDIKGLGVKKIILLWKEYGIQDLYQLQEFINSGAILNVKGFGKKTTENISSNIQLYLNSQGKVLYAEAEKMLFQICTILNQKYPELNIGEYELFSDFQKFIDTHNILGNVAPIGEVAMRNDVISSFELIIDHDEFEQVVRGLEESLNLVNRNVDESFISYENINGLSYKFHRVASVSMTQMVESISNTHFAKNNPKNTIQEYEKYPLYLSHSVSTNNIDKVVQQSDIKGVVHSHTIYSDGMSTVSEMARAAQEKGYEYLVITDHSEAAFYANGLNEERLRIQMSEIDELNAKNPEFRILKGIECDILNDGSMDLNDQILSELDVVIASIHSILNMSQEKAMSRLLRAIENPHVDMLGHMTGRLLLSRKGYPVDHEKIIQTCADHNTIIEINAHPRRLDIDSRYLGMCQDAGVGISINPDAHSISGIDDIRYGVISAQKGGLLKTNCINSYSVDDFLARLK